MVRIALIEDDERISLSLSRALIERGHDVRRSATGLAGLQLVVDDPPDVIVLDLGLPDIDGVDLLKMVRAVSRVPVIGATARDDEGEIVRTLDAGADDYIVKPFSVSQLDARIRAVLRRVETPDEDAVAVGPLLIDRAGRIASLRGTELELTRKEFDLLAYLGARAGRVVSRRELLSEVWGQPYSADDQTLDTHLSWLRRKLGESARRPGFIRTVRGVGVKLVDPDS